MIDPQRGYEWPNPSDSRYEIDYLKSTNPLRYKYSSFYSDDSKFEIYSFLP